MWQGLSTRLWTTPSLFLLLLGGALFLLSVALFDVARALDSLAWPSAEGVVISSEVYEVFGWNGDSGGWCPNVAYQYSVAGKDYASQSVWIGPRICSGNTDYFARHAVLRYPPGEPVTVFYDPRHPASSVLEPGIHGFSGLAGLAASCIGVALFATGLLGILGLVKVPTGQRAP